MGTHVDSGRYRIRYSVIDTTERKREPGTLGRIISFHVSLEAAMIALWTARLENRKATFLGLGERREFSTWESTNPDGHPARRAANRFTMASPEDWKPYGEEEE